MEIEHWYVLCSCFSQLIDDNLCSGQLCRSARVSVPHYSILLPVASESSQNTGICVGTFFENYHSCIARQELSYIDSSVNSSSLMSRVSTDFCTSTPTASFSHYFSQYFRQLPHSDSAEGHISPSSVAAMEIRHRLPHAAQIPLVLTTATATATVSPLRITSSIHRARLTRTRTLTKTITITISEVRLSHATNTAATVSQPTSKAETTTIAGQRIVGNEAVITDGPRVTIPEEGAARSIMPVGAMLKKVALVWGLLAGWLVVVGLLVIWL